MLNELEYKFDQLKVETLEGTLNIGLNPTDLQGIEDFSVPTQKRSSHAEVRGCPLFTEIENSIHQYLDTNLQSIMAEYWTTTSNQVDETYR